MEGKTATVSGKVAFDVSRNTKCRAGMHDDRYARAVSRGWVPGNPRALGNLLEVRGAPAREAGVQARTGHYGVRDPGRSTNWQKFAKW